MDESRTASADSMKLNHVARIAFAALVLTRMVPVFSQERLIGALRNQHIIDGCAWSASSTDVGPGFILLAEYDESIVVMNIGGMDVQLALDPSSETGAPSRVGERRTKVYTALTVRVEATYTTTWVCPPGQEGCEVTKFDVTFRVRRGDQIETVEAVGEVGC